MRIVVTGGGTGGHVYPALEVARALRDAGAETRYVGSLRGSEGAASVAAGVAFAGFHLLPLTSLRSLAGWRALAAMARAIPATRANLRRDRPDVLFSTGGYGAAAAMAAARGLGIPLAIHAVDAVPGRTLRMHARAAAAFTSGFRAAEGELAGRGRIPRGGVERTGHPIRRELRAATERAEPDEELLLVVGGSQGSAFLNGAVADAAGDWPGRVLLATGPKLHDEWRGRFAPNVEARPYLSAAEMAEAYRTAGLALARAGGTIAEFAMARLPSVLVPLPGSADDHQARNADEFAAFGGATRLEQAEATRERLVEALLGWGDEAKRESARAGLAAWDVPDAAERIAAAVIRAASGGSHRNGRHGTN